MTVGALLCFFASFFSLYVEKNTRECAVQLVRIAEPPTDAAPVSAELFRSFQRVHLVKIAA